MRTVSIVDVEDRGIRPDRLRTEIFHSWVISCSAMRRFRLVEGCSGNLMLP